MTVIVHDLDASLGKALEALAGEPHSACLLDPGGRIVAVNGAWDDFAEANGGAARCRGEALLGTAYLQHVDGEAPRARVEQELASALAGRRLSVDSECNSPDRLRYLRSLYVPVRESDAGPVVGALVVHTTVAEGPVDGVRPVAEPVEATYRGDDGLLAMCSSCRRVRRHQAHSTWDYVPAFVASMPGRVTHVLCAACVAEYGITLAEVQTILGA